MQHEPPTVPVDAYKGESALSIKPSDKPMEHALLEVALKPGLVIIDHLPLATQLVSHIGADDDTEAIAECFNSALSMSDVVVKHARDEVAILKLNLPLPFKLAFTVLASLEPGNEDKSVYLQI